MPSLLNRMGSIRGSTVSKEYKCTVQLLDDEQTVAVEFKKDALGQVVLDYVCDMLNLAERDYFGLRYVDANRHRYWLDTSKPILRQIKSATPIVFAFRVKYYPVDPSVLHEQLTRYLVVMQLKRDLLHGRLYCPQNDAAILGAYIIQTEVGDYDPDEHTGNYVSQFKMFLNQTPRLEEKIALEHQNLKGKGITPAEADVEFLRKACTLDTYGYYPFTVKDIKNGQVYVGATPRGLLIYQAHKKLHHLAWTDIKGFDYSGKEFFIYTTDEYLNEHAVPEDDLHEHVSPDEEIQRSPRMHGDTEHKATGKKKAALRYVCPSATFCKHLWKYMLAEEAFFTKRKANEVKPIVIRRGPIFRRSTFRYSGRVLQEIKEATSPKRPEPAFDRIHVARQLPRDERDAPWAKKFHTLPRATMKTVPESRTLDDILNKTAPDVLNTTRNSLLLETTSQSTPIGTPMSGLSPLSENGPWAANSVTNTSKLLNGPNESSYSVSQTSMIKSPGSAYQSEVITVRLKRVDPIDLEETHQETNDDVLASTQETQRRAVEAVKTTTIKSTVNGKLSDGHVEKKTAYTAVSTTAVSSGNINNVHPAATEQRADSGRALWTSILTGLMFLILVLATVIVVMEIQDAEFRRYIRQVTGDDAFRRNVYDPMRQRVVDVYGRVFK